ncbi:hypothetical protein [Bradyrhizobium sp. Leo121]|uniref:hypothetical protein n=1 Tax=Bradyrhizobium sp. Leo121 TaxID=1571195 RepID=UPI00102A8693|nr:hypothetical protein [Bradyrhizobium sp. Leo121]RZN13889.1 hypothetical protein CWO90_44010 [Bradyrhizobium sp. Leo121]
MSVRYLRRSPIAAVILLPLLANQPLTFARGSPVGHEDPWNSERIDRLPPEVRSAITRMCGNATAAHYFATFFDNSRLIKLHFEHLHCDKQARFCTGTSCLRQEFISTGKHYRLQRSYYGHDDD